MGALYFTRRVHRTRVPKGFKLPHDQQKYDGSQEPTLWLSDYLQAVQIFGGTRETAMQSLQLHLTDAPHRRSTVLVKHTTQRFYRELGRTRRSVARNFHLTYKLPALLEEVKSYVQRKEETLRSYIQDGI
jgi:hypothetical protein